LCDSAAELAGADPKTVARYVEARDDGGNPFVHARRRRFIDAFLEKIEELVDRSKANVRADVVHARIEAMGFEGDPRTTRRAVAEVKEAWRAGHRRRFPAMGAGAGDVVPVRLGRRTHDLRSQDLSVLRLVGVVPVPGGDPDVGQDDGHPGRLPGRRLARPRWSADVSAVGQRKDRHRRARGGIPVRHPTMVAVGRHYGCKVESCRPYDPESKGGSEATVKIAKRDLVPTTANLLPEYSSFAELVAAADAFCEKVNSRPHRETGRPPIEMLVEERAWLHVLPDSPHTAALGETRRVDDDQTIRWGSVRYSTPDGHQGAGVWCRVVGDELVIVGDVAERGLVEIARHELSTPGHPRSWTSTTRTIGLATDRRPPSPHRAAPPKPPSWRSAPALNGG
jgi:hypothetical protein